MKTNYQEIINQALNILRDGLRPTFEKHWKQAWGDQWIEMVHNALGGNLPNPRPDDNHFLLKGIVCTYGMLQHRGVSKELHALITLANGYRNECAHNDIVDIDQSLQILQNFRKILHEVGDQKRADQIAQIYEELIAKKKTQPSKAINPDTQNTFLYQALGTGIERTLKGVKDILIDAGVNRQELDHILNGALSIDHPIIQENLEEESRQVLLEIMSARQRLEQNQRFTKPEIANVLQVSHGFLTSIGQPVVAQQVLNISRQFGLHPSGELEDPIEELLHDPNRPLVTTSPSNGPASIASAETSEIAGEHGDPVRDSAVSANGQGGNQSSTVASLSVGQKGEESSAVAISSNSSSTVPQGNTTKESKPAQNDQSHRQALTKLLIRLGILATVWVLQSLLHRRQQKQLKQQLTRASRPRLPKLPQLPRLPRVQIRINR